MLSQPATFGCTLGGKRNLLSSAYIVIQLHVKHIVDITKVLKLRRKRQRNIKNEEKAFVA